MSLSPVLARVDEDKPGAVRRSCCLGHEHLPSVSGRHHTSLLVHVETDVLRWCQGRLTGLDPDPDADWQRVRPAVVGERPLSLLGCRDCLGRR